MSGGVDSAVAAALLLERGFQVTGYHMKNLPDKLFELYPEKKKTCCSPTDRRDASLIADKLGIELKIVALGDLFSSHVIDYFVKEYTLGRTPNPCVVCNDQLKFGELMKRALDDGMELFASGHYARIIDHPIYGKALARGVHEYKDQSYALARLERTKLDRLVMPNGEFTKDQIRKRATDLGLPVHGKKESQELCFIPDNDYRRFLSEEGVTPRHGKIVDQNGTVLGEHDGLPFFTVGQRHGLGITSSERLYVLSMDYKNNTLVVGHVSSTYGSGFVAGNLNWIIKKPEEYFKCICMIRSTMKGIPAIVRVKDDVAEVEFEKPAQFVTPGQLAVFFDQDIVIGSGFIR